MPGISFDRAADFYDATRGYPAGVAEQVRDGLVRELRISPQTHLLEIGIGTGRIALPFLQAGYRYTGLDLSSAMLARLRAKLPGRPVQLCRGDVMFLPFADQRVDIVVAAHILHLVEDWRQAIDEAWRVLRPGGAFVSLHDARHAAWSNPIFEQVYKQWNAILADLGYTPARPRRHGGFGIGEQVSEYVSARQATTRQIDLAEFTAAATTAREMVRRLKARINSGEWAIPDDIHAEGIRRLEHWLNQECDQPDTSFADIVRVRALIVIWKNRESEHS